MIKDCIEKERLIVIIRGVEKEKIIPVLTALYENGVRLAEITFDQSGKTSDKETAEKIAMAVKHFEGKMFIGAGTVLNKKQVKLAKKAGCKFIISPDMKPSVIKCTKKSGMISIPGAMTVTEIEAAHTAGADYIKVFPAAAVGPRYFKDVAAPLPTVKLLAVGGIGCEEIDGYLKNGAYGFGVGSGIVSKELSDRNDYETIGKNANEYVSKCRKTEK
ncbi:MAG: bifunctional 4-hydroxy-2-oxoglutarate aldolase/2-dehydro-3-deoxy-phosphogluconate aldolase [Clostridia bacterium]|nr:bifunctional 4-hydroxy-2-oxoglutarate aldolase/2-dehydro-3-deoxy-phosphogluconate aldolase [Clostridia bacterium]